MKLYRNIIIILLCIFLIEGFSGEFMAFTISDIIKWTAISVAWSVYFICKKIKTSN